MNEPGKMNNCKECRYASQCFQHLYPDELEFINEKKMQLIYRPGENLFKQGAFSPYVMYVADGLVKMYLQTGPEKIVNLRLAKTGEFLAFSSLFGTQVYNYSASAIKESLICMIDKNALNQLIGKNSDFAIRITSANCRCEEHFIHIIKNISYKQMRGKLASALLYLASDEFKGFDVFQTLSRREIADFACISTESAIRFLKEFEKEGIISLNGKNVRITDKKKLVDIAKRG